MCLSLASCKKNLKPISFPENMVTSYEMYAGEIMDIKFTVNNIAEDDLSVEAEMDNPAFDYNIKDKKDNAFTIAVIAPSEISTNTVGNLKVDVTDYNHPEREPISCNIVVTAKPRFK